MWPLMLDMTKQESRSMLKSLEREAYSCLISALRAQGSLNEEKMRILKDISIILNISQNSHKAEIRRAVNDERLRTIAYILTGMETSDEWAMEGRRTIPLMPRTAPQTAYSAIADEIADNTSIANDQLPYPAQTERKRCSLQTLNNDSLKNQQYRVSDTQKHLSEDMYSNKKRKVSYSEPTQLAQHLMGPPKISRIQQIYRQKTKAKLREQQMQQQLKQEIPHKMKQEHQKLKHHEHKRPYSIQNFSAGVRNLISNDDNASNLNMQLKDETRLSPVPGCSNEHSPKFRTHPVITKSSQGLQNIETMDLQQQKTIKICSNRRPATPKLTSLGQKLIIVSNAQTIPSSSILQRSLQGPLSIKTLEKVKIIGTTSSPVATCNSITTAAIVNKPKMVTMRTNATTKKLNIPILQLNQGVHLQAISTKGSVKMVPMSGKLLTKASVVNTNSGTPIYFMNAVGNVEALTKATTATSVIMTTKPQESVSQDETQISVEKNSNTKNSETENGNSDNAAVDAIKKEPIKSAAEKSSVLSEILEASGVLAADENTANSETETDQDIESKISKLTEIPREENEALSETESQQIAVNASQEEAEIVSSSEEIRDVEEEVENEEYVAVIQESDNSQEGADYVILEDNPDVLLCQLETQTTNSDILDLIETLDPETGQYSIQAASSAMEEEETIVQCEENVEIEEELEEGYVIIHNSELDMPSLTAISE